MKSKLTFIALLIALVGTAGITEGMRGGRGRGGAGRGRMGGMRSSGMSRGGMRTGRGRGYRPVGGAYASRGRGRGYGRGSYYGRGRYGRWGHGRYGRWGYPRRWHRRYWAGSIAPIVYYNTYPYWWDTYTTYPVEQKELIGTCYNNAEGVLVCREKQCYRNPYTNREECKIVDVPVEDDTSGTTYTVVSA